jgi:protein-S-isoprenylcysteine O-methyltransferase Ste14
MSEIQARPSRVPWPPLIYLAAIAASVVLNLLYPLPYYIEPPLSDILFGVGWLLIVGAFAIHASAFRALRRAKTTMMPHRASEHLVTSGPYSFTRNPIYLANTMIMVGAGLIATIAWFFLLAIVASFLTQKLAIEREERHLEARFGKKYRDYAKRVRRWI